MQTDIQSPILLLTAHPDDECMFFAPSVLGLRKSGKDVHGLCLSVGNADGLGLVRRKELVRSYGVLGVEKKKVNVLDHPELQDDIKRAWNRSLVAKIVEEYVRGHGIASIITFDAHGISSHPNHISLFHSAQLLRTSSPEIRLWTLHTTGVLAKYTGYLGAIWPGKGMVVYASGMGEYATALGAMREHWSQLVWFRWLYVGWSRYMWVNELVEV
ncbi:N-acetylglucosaminyl-phosphatidylinositol de-N-acetylase [Ceratobasidium sp. 428]|nr:N-acetylglucosaminyl-phosphatidylinositol de-N-acetylase [Ceratobasidium sp. 428]